ncbi:MAG: peptidase M14, partial [Planctomycetia bacterium]
GETDWFYDMLGVMAFTNELNTPFNFFRQDAKGMFFGAPEQVHKFNKLLLFGDGFVPWKEYDHPQYGKIEIGGLKKTWQRQPPSFLLEEECHRNMAFTLYHADQMPLVSVDAVTVRDLGGGLKQIDAVVSNDRLVPTRLAVDVSRKLSAPDVATLTGPNVAVLAAWRSLDPFFAEDVVEQKRRPAALKIDAVPGKRAVHLRWLATGAGPYTVELKTLKGGSAVKTIP